MEANDFIFQPTGDKNLYYSNNRREHECIGHLRGDLGSSGQEFWTTWFPHEAHARNTPAFKADFQHLMDKLRQSVLANMSSMRKLIRECPHPLEDQGYNSPHGYLVSTDSYDYYVRCIPVRGDYNFYIYCYVRGEE